MDLIIHQDLIHLHGFLNFFVSETSSHSIRKIDLRTSTVSTKAGFSRTSGSNDRTWQSARFNSPKGLELIFHSYTSQIQETI
jgi:hypothetical protein